MISNYALIAFLIVYGISVFAPFNGAKQIAAVAAIIAGAGMLLGF